MILSRKQASVSETRAQPPMGKFIQLSDGVFTRWKNCMTALSLESDSEMAEFLLNRLLEDRLREMGQQNSREGTPSPIPSDSGVSGKGSSSPSHLTTHSGVHSPSPKTSASHPTAATEPITGSEKKLEHGTPAGSVETSTHSSDFAEYKHKLERRKRKPAVEHHDTAIKVAKTASESEGRSDSETSKQASSGKSSADEPVVTGASQVACVPISTDQKDERKQDVIIIQRQDVIVTPRSQSQRSSEAFHGACGEEAMDLSVRPTKDSFMEGLGHEHVGQRNVSSNNDRDPSHPNYQSTLRRERGPGHVGVYDSSDLSDGSVQCVSPQPSLNNNKVSSNDSVSDFDSCSGSPMNTVPQGGQGGEELENSPKPGANMGGIESIVQRLHQVKSETPSRSDSEDESDYYAVTFKDLIARTISRCDRYGKTQPRGKRKRASRTSSELNAARKEEIMAAKKLLERVSKNKRDKFKLTINCSTDGSEHVRNAAASEAIATLVRSVWHKENPKPIGQVIKEMVAKRLADQEGEENDPTAIGQSKRKGPMTIKDILNSRSDNVVEEYNRSAKDKEGEGEVEVELLVVSDDGMKVEMEDEADPALSAAETLKKMAKSNEKRDENCAETVIPAGQQKHQESAVSEKAIDVKTKLSKERDGNDDDSDDEDLSIDHEQRKKAKRRSRKKNNRLTKLSEKGIKLNEDETVSSVPGQKGLKEISQKVDTSDSRGNECLPVTKKDTETLVHSPDHEVTQWPAEAVKMKGSVAENVVQMSGDVGMRTMRSLVENIQDEDEEVDVVMETKEIPRPRKERTASPQRTLSESIPFPKIEPLKPVVISHSISQILEQKGTTSSVDNRGRCSSRSNSVISATHNPVQVEPNTAYESPSNDQVAPGLREPGKSSSVVGLDGTDQRVGEESTGEGGQGEIKSMSTATEFLIRIALMQNDGTRQGVVETK
ncbi:uncharacterized protein LOC579169 isoform X1 [Strongylocentrotus purpuratus]|uniref:Uncharacterized protein n=2 Tax=Strongylocentrotus purpuratus TaxID=7668 RepID=A0A7M7HR62_STRPU|nr:uncharacterized protein LOC579169 isoform X1 [Strongylocentrotus purpuratus]